VTKTITITVSEDTLKRLEELRMQLGLTKSQAIAYAVNTIVMEKYVAKGVTNENSK